MTNPSNHRCNPFPLATTEARGLAHLVEHGTTVEAVHDLINVSPQMEAQLRRHAELLAGRYPKEAQYTLGMIAWRRQVLVEFDLLLQEEAAGASWRPKRSLRCRVVSRNAPVSRY